MKAQWAVTVIWCIGPAAYYGAELTSDYIELDATSCVLGAGRHAVAGHAGVQGQPDRAMLSRLATSTPAGALTYEGSRPVELVPDDNVGKGGDSPSSTPRSRRRRHPSSWLVRLFVETLRTRMRRSTSVHCNPQYCDPSNASDARCPATDGAGLKFSQEFNRRSRWDLRR